MAVPPPPPLNFNCINMKTEVGMEKIIIFSFFTLRHIPSSDQGDKIDNSCIIVDEKDPKKTLFKKKSTSSACAVR